MTVPYDKASHLNGVDSASYVRRSAGSAAIAAVLMCLLGFGYYEAPAPKDLFGWCNLLFYYTLCIGGIAYALVALWCLTGHPLALIADGMLSVLVGAVFMTSGIGMLIDGGAMLNSVLITVFGWLFAGSGLRDFKIYRYVTQARGTAGHEAAITPAEGLHGSQDSRLTTGLSPINDDVDQVDHERDPYDRDESDHANGDADDPHPPTDGGFLSDLARQGRPPRV